MNFKDKLLVQVIVCLAIFAVIRGFAMMSGDGVTKFKDKVSQVASKNYSIEEIKDAGSDLVTKIGQAPSTIASVVTKANEVGDYGAPIDENEDKEILSVHAVAGGEVIYAGIDKELGVCIRIQHDEKVSTYGNLYTLTAVTGDRVAKGDIIATFDNREESQREEFYYQLA